MTKLNLNYTESTELNCDRKVSDSEKGTRREVCTLHQIPNLTKTFPLIILKQHLFILRLSWKLSITSENSKGNPVRKLIVLESDSLSVHFSPQWSSGASRRVSQRCIQFDSVPFSLVHFGFVCLVSKQDDRLHFCLNLRMQYKHKYKYNKFLLAVQRTRLFLSQISFATLPLLLGYYYHSEPIIFSLKPRNYFWVWEFVAGGTLRGGSERILGDQENSRGATIMAANIREQFSLAVKSYGAVSLRRLLGDTSSSSSFSSALDQQFKAPRFLPHKHPKCRETVLSLYLE